MEIAKIVIRSESLRYRGRDEYIVADYVLMYDVALLRIELWGVCPAVCRIVNRTPDKIVGACREDVAELLQVNFENVAYQESTTISVTLKLDILSTSKICTRQWLTHRPAIQIVYIKIHKVRRLF